MSARAIVVDVEGTTTPIRFVKDVLFPDSAERMASFIAQHGAETEVRAALHALLTEAGEPGASDQRAVELARSWIAEDRKVGPLKALQGMIWEEGYRAGRFRGPLYPDVVPRLTRWSVAGARLAVYSSGSVRAQQLLFAHSTSGDVTGLFDRFFDTGVGGKKSAASYEAIARALGLAPREVLFLSDAPEELDAAAAAGMRVVGLAREGAPPEGSPHAWAHSFDEVTP